MTLMMGHDDRLGEARIYAYSCTLLAACSTLRLL